MTELVDYRAESKRMLLDPMTWPRWPILPMKRHTKNQHVPEIGVVRAVKGELTTVYLIGMFEIEKDTNWKTLAKLTYNTVDEMLDDGWEVD